MEIPQKPPSLHALFERVLSPDNGHSRYSDLLLSGAGPCPEGKYRHWDTFRRIAPPDGFTVEEGWLALKLARHQLYQRLPITDSEGQPFVYALPGLALQMLQRIDRDASGNIGVPEQVTDPRTRDKYLIKSLMEEAITSSQLEGASTTRRVAKQMLQEGRRPRNRSETMIYNNYRAMQFIREILSASLTPQLVFELQAILTEGTLEEPDAAGRLRQENEQIGVMDIQTGAMLHDPPPAAVLDERLNRMCEFANEANSAEFMHPVIRAILLHFWLAYDHPFVDGNGRTARALFYWAMAKRGYWLAEYISISSILRKAPSKYARAFLYTETDENDATYFVLYQLKVIGRAIEALHEYLRRKAAEFREIDDVIHSTTLRDRLNHRQLGLLHHALKNEDAQYTVESHRRSNDVSYQTARSDLLKLADLELLEQRQIGRAFRFRAPRDLRKRLARWSDARARRRAPFP